MERGAVVNGDDSCAVGRDHPVRGPARRIRPRHAPGFWRSAWQHRVDERSSTKWWDSRRRLSTRPTPGRKRSLRT